MKNVFEILAFNMLIVGCCLVVWNCFKFVCKLFGCMSTRVSIKNISGDNIVISNTYTSVCKMFRKNGQSKIIIDGKEVYSTEDSILKVVLEGTPCNVNVSGDLTCKDIRGYVDCSGDVFCGNIGGNVDVSGNLTCKDIENGYVDVSGNLTCNNIKDSVDCSGNITCGSIGGNVECSGGIKLNSVCKN